MSIHALLELAREQQLTVTWRVKPLVEGYTVLIQAGYPGSARPLFEKSFAADVPRAGHRRDGGRSVGLLRSLQGGGAGRGGAAFECVKRAPRIAVRPRVPEWRQAITAARASGMCNDYANHIGAAEIGGAFSELRIPLRFPQGIPNIEPRDDIRITDPGAVVRAASGGGGGAELVTMRWSWPGPGGRPVYNFRSEGRSLASGRCLIVADGFYEFTAVEGAKKNARKAKWRFTMAGEPWFCIAGLWRNAPGVGDAFTMLTAPPGPDVAPYHDRQIVVLARENWGRWLDPAVPAGEALRSLPAGSLTVERVV